MRALGERQRELLRKLVRFGGDTAPGLASTQMTAEQAAAALRRLEQRGHRLPHGQASDRAGVRLDRYLDRDDRRARGAGGGA